MVDVDAKMERASSAKYVQRKGGFAGNVGKRAWSSKGKKRSGGIV
jgi:hypothetical protein